MKYFDITAGSEFASIREFPELMWDRRFLKSIIPLRIATSFKFLYHMFDYDYL